MYKLPNQYFVDIQMNLLEKEGYKKTVIGELLLNANFDLNNADPNAVAMINPKDSTDIVCVAYILENAYEYEMLELAYQQEQEQEHNAATEYWYEPMGCYVSKYNYYD